MSQIVLTTIGSLGDLHPFIALGLGSRDRFFEADFYRPVVDTSIPVIVISPGLGVDKSNFDNGLILLCCFSASSLN